MTDLPAVRSMRRNDIDQLLTWATLEGWNPGLDDADAFFCADPNGFFMAMNGDEPAACVSVVRHSPDQAFLGLYICAPKYRGQGFGMAVWRAGMQYANGSTIGLDGVVEQQDNYQKSGFMLAHRTLRFSGKPARLAAASHENSDIRSVEPADIPMLLTLDTAVHGYSRQRYMENWLANRKGRYSVLAQSGNVATGFATIRACQEHYKIGPVIARDNKLADALIGVLLQRVLPEEIILDVPMCNRAAVDLAEHLQLTPVFETARMYCGRPPNAQDNQIFGVTTLELG